MSSSAPPAPGYRKFGWPMRLFLAVLLFDIVFRSLSVLFPWSSWASELQMGKMPVRLATRAEREHMVANARPGESPVVEDVMVVCDSVWEYFKPWPGPETRARLDAREKKGKFALCWLSSRLEFCENVLGINEEWTMFSPGTSKSKYVARARLEYDDGSQLELRTLADPQDLTRYSHWNQEKILDHLLRVSDSRDRLPEAEGFCNLLSHRHAPNDRQAALKSIWLFMVRYDFPPPGVDARAFLEAQNGPPLDQRYPYFYEFDVANRHGRYLLPE